MMSLFELLEKLKWNLPWLARYPFERTRNLLGPAASEAKHIVFTVADHFEPSWSPNGLLPLEEQKRKLEEFYRMARTTGEALRDADGRKFGHTFFYPAEQYFPELLETTADMQKEGLGEVEVHLHHGLNGPDTAENLRKSLIEFRDVLAADHRCLSRWNGEGEPKYAFVHGNLALANSAGGRYCGVDEEMAILADTGCYADMTLPSAPDRTQVPVINKIYECGNPLNEPVPHRSGESVKMNGRLPQLPIIFTGPLVLNWKRRLRGFPLPRLDDGALVYNQPMTLDRLRRWKNANITVKGRPEWVFVKLYCHGFFPQDQAACIGEDAVRFFSKVIEFGESRGGFKVHFASAREASNMVFAAVDGNGGDPNIYRDYVLKSIMGESDVESAG